MTIEGKRQSIPLTEGPSRAAARSYLRGVGFSKEDLHKPIIGIANTWTEIGPCNFHLRDIAEAVKQGIREAGGTPMEFNTITISRRHHHGHARHEGLADLPRSHRRLHRARRPRQLFDGLVCIAGCDKNMPGIIMALCRLDIPGMMLYGGSIAPGKLKQPDGKQRHHHPQTSSKASARTPPASITTPASKPRSRRLSRRRSLRRPVHRQHHGHGRRVSRHLAHLSLRRPATRRTSTKPRASRPHRHGCSPRQSASRPRRSSPASPSRTPSPASPPGRLDQRRPPPHRHRPRARHPAHHRRLRRISERTPFICDLSPGGKYVAKDYQAAGGSRLLAKRLIEAGLPTAAQLTISGKTLAEEAALAVETPGQVVIHTFENPIKPTGGLVILKGNLAPEGCVIKVAGHERVEHRGPRASSTPKTIASPPSKPARSSPTTSSSSATKAPSGGPGMREMLQSPPPSSGNPELSAHVALLTDGRFSGATRGLMPATSPPKPSVGGPIAAVREGDTITFDIPNRKLTLEVSEEEIAKRASRASSPRAALAARGVFRKYVDRVTAPAKAQQRQPNPGFVT
jgi:dihydroxy-acid dehydratase